MNRTLLLVCVVVCGCGPQSDDELVQVDRQGLSSDQLVTGQSGLSTVPSKQVSVSCPKGTRALGAGWSALDSTGAFLPGQLTAFEPAWDGSSWLANVTLSPQSYTSNWQLELRVRCALPPAGYQVVEVQSALSTVTSVQLDVVCPSGSSVTGAGFGALDSTGAFIRGTPTYFYPGWNGADWVMNVSANGSWKLRSRAVCATTSSLPGYRVVTSVNALTTGTVPQQNITSCPKGPATAGGWAVTDSTNAILAGTVTLSAGAYDFSRWVTNAAALWAAPKQRWSLSQRLICVN